jgi:hypothetical protein
LTQDRLLRGGCHRAALRAAPLSGNDSGSNRACLIVCTVISLTVGPFVTARTPSSAKEPAMTNDHMRNLHRDAWRGELTEDQLEKVSGGHAVVAPRDAVSGMATGRRTH